jgi:hypothetical protein
VADREVLLFKERLGKHLYLMLQVLVPLQEGLLLLVAAAGVDTLQLQP